MKVGRDVAGRPAASAEAALWLVDCWSLQSSQSDQCLEGFWKWMKRTFALENGLSNCEPTALPRARIEYAKEPPKPI